MGYFSNPFRSTCAPESRGRRRRNPHFAPESLERRLSPSDFGITGTAQVARLGEKPEGGTPPDCPPDLPDSPSGPA